jgi:hypothetical protein
MQESNMNDVERARERALKAGKFLVLTTWVSIFAHVFCGAINVMQHNVITAAMTGQYTSKAALIELGNRTVQLYLIGGSARWIIDGAGIILLLVWVYRSDALARALGSDRMAHGPTGSVGWFFVPVVNLVKPFLVLKEIYLATVMPKRYDMDLPASGLLTMWWLALIADRLFGLAISQWPEKSKGLEAKLEAVERFMISEVTWVLASGLLIMVVMAFMREQASSKPYQHSDGLAFAM